MPALSSPTTSALHHHPVAVVLLGTALQLFLKFFAVRRRQLVSFQPGQAVGSSAQPTPGPPQAGRAPKRNRAEGVGAKAWRTSFFFIPTNQWVSIS